MNTRYNINPEKVTISVNKKIQEYEKYRLQQKESVSKALESYNLNSRFFSKKPDLDCIDPMVDRWIKYEKEYYSTVRIIKVSKPITLVSGEIISEGFILVYGDADDATAESGTGVFKTLEEAESWFTNQGR